MNDWVYRIFMTVLIANIGIGVYAVYTAPQPDIACLNGIVMVRKDSMYVQRGLMFGPEHCMAIDTN